MIKKLYYDENYSIREIAEMYGMSYSGMRAKMLREGIKLKDNKASMQTDRVRAKRSKNATGASNSQWNGGRRKTADGYIEIYSPDHPNKSVRNTVYEHRLVMEEHLGRYLLPTEVVHHINEIKDDNRIDNLMLFASESEHQAHHRMLASRM